MRTLIAATIVSLFCQRAVFADVICGHTVTPVLQLVYAVEGTDTFLQATGGGPNVIVVYTSGIVAEYGVSSEHGGIAPGGSCPAGPLIPFVAGFQCGAATSNALATLNLAMQQLHIGLQRDCQFVDPYILGLLSAEYRVRWFGRAGRVNEFRMSSRPKFPACPAPQVQALLGALNQLVGTMKVMEWTRAEFSSPSD